MVTCMFQRWKNPRWSAHHPRARSSTSWEPRTTWTRKRRHRLPLAWPLDPSKSHACEREPSAWYSDQHLYPCDRGRYVYARISPIAGEPFGHKEGLRDDGRWPRLDVDDVAIEISSSLNQIFYIWLYSCPRPVIGEKPPGHVMFFVACVHFRSYAYPKSKTNVLLTTT